MIEDGGLILPSRMFVVAGDISLIYLRAIVPVEDPEVFEYAITCTCDFAVLQRRRVLLTPDTKVRGQFSLLVEVRTPAGDLVDRRSLEVSVVDPQAGSGQSFQMLMVGDSLGHANHFPDELANLLRRPGNPDVTFVGSFRPPGSTIPHEQYGGWTFWHFNELFNADPRNFQKDRSPFVFPGEGGKPVFDAQRYFDETLGGARPRNIHIQLGINDAFGLLPNDPGLAEKLDAILRQADLLIAGLLKPLPDAIITVGSVIQANATERAFVESYQKAGEELRSEWRWRQVQMRLARKMVEHFEGREAERIYLVPTHMAVDPIESYKPHPYMVAAFDFKIGNAVHPNSTGDAQLASAIFAVLKAELASAAIH
jgi:lysophospholipase L1-like esterase